MVTTTEMEIKVNHYGATFEFIIPQATRYVRISKTYYRVENDNFGKTSVEKIDHKVARYILSTELPEVFEYSIRLNH